MKNLSIEEINDLTDKVISDFIEFSKLTNKKYPLLFIITLENGSIYSLSFSKKEVENLIKSSIENRNDIYILIDILYKQIENVESIELFDLDLINKKIFNSNEIRKKEKLKIDSLEKIKEEYNELFKR